jgi:hypothetical protein
VVVPKDKILTVAAEDLNRRDADFAERLKAKGPTCRPRPPDMRPSRDHEYVRMGTLSLLTGIDLATGVVHASVEKRHRSREFVADLARFDAAYPPPTAIKIMLGNHSAPRLLAQPHRGLLLKARPVRASPHPRRLAPRTAAANPRKPSRGSPSDPKDVSTSRLTPRSLSCW